jgi:TonB family protein
VSYKILLIEQDSEAAERIRASLTDADHELVTVGDVDEALESFERERPDLALVSDGSPEIPAAALCTQLKETPQGRITPVIFLATELPQDQAELARRIERFGCDQIVEKKVAGELLLQLCDQLLGGNGQETGETGETVSVVTAHERAAAAKFLDSAGLVDAVEKIDTVTTHRTVSRAPTAQSPPQASAGDDKGEDIADHLDSLFASGLPTGASRQTTPARSPEPAKRAVAPVKAPIQAGGPAAQAPRPTPRPAQTKAAPPASTTQPMPAVHQKAKSHAKKSPARVQARPAAAAPAAVSRPQASVRKQKPPVRETPKAVEQLRRPRVLEPETAVGRSERRWLRTAGWIAAAVVVIGLLAAAGYLIFVRDHTSPVEPLVAQATVEPEPLPAPPPLEATPLPVESATQEAPPAVITKEPPAPERTPPTTEKPATEKPKQREPSPPKPAAKAAASAQPTPTVTSAPPDPQPTKTQPAPAEATRTGTPATPTPKPSKPPTAVPVATETAPTPPPTKTPAGTETRSDPAPPPEETVKPVAAEPAKPATTEPVFAPPAVVERVDPKYSAKATKGIDNPVVVLRILVDERGRIARVLVDEGIPGSELESAAISAVLRWRFKPATEDNLPVKAWTSVRFVFEN